MKETENISPKIDDTDIKIMRILQRNSKIPIKELSERINLSPTPIYDRIKRLEKIGVIRKYVALLDLEKTNNALITYCNVQLDKHSPIHLKEFENNVKNYPEVIECYYLAGNYDYLLKIVTKNMKAYQDFIINTLSGTEHVQNIQSSFVMGIIKYTTELPIK